MLKVFSSSSLTQMPPLEKKKKRHFSVEPNISLNYLLSRVNMNDVGELDSVLETNKLEIETLNKELASTDRRRGKKKVRVFSKILFVAVKPLGFSLPAPIHQALIFMHI